MPYPRRALTARRPRFATAVLALLFASSACGLQSSGRAGILRADTTTSGRPAPASTGGLPGGTTGAGTATSGSGALGGTGSSGVADTTGSLGPAGSGTGIAGGTRPSAGSTGGTGAAAPQSPGLEGELVVAYVNVTGFDELGKIVNIKAASTGDAIAQTRALAAYVNSHGGIAGRKLIPRVHDYNAQQASEVNDNNLCQAITTTDKAFMVDLQGQIHYSARSCYAAKKTLAFEGSGFGWGRSFYDQHDPFLWSPSYADYDQAERALVSSIRARSWLAGQTKVGVVLWDDQPYHDVADRVLVPALKAAGVEVVKAAVSNADIGSIENGIHAAAQTMIVNSVTHLMFIGSAPLQPFFVQQNQQHTQFVYAFTSFDIPRYMAVNFPDNMKGALGIGFSPVNDVLDAQYSFPQPGRETQCVAIYRAGGVDIPDRFNDATVNSQQAMSFCESTLLLKEVADTIPDNLTPSAWGAAARRLGSRFQVAQTFTTSFSPTKRTGAAAYRETAFNTGCSCMTYTSGNRPLS